MTTLETAPGSVRGWFAARASDDPVPGLRLALADGAYLEFAGRRVQGAAAVIAHVLAMPAPPTGQIRWRVLSQPDPQHVTVRGTAPDGGPLPSPGGPMSAMDFTFALDFAGLITEIHPVPHHTEPADLREALAPGQQAPGFSLPDTAGRVHTLAPAEAAATAVVFTCNACPWALGWHESIQAVARDYAGRGVTVLQVNANDPGVSPKDAVDVSRQRVVDGAFAGPYLLDEGQQVARRWGARHTPDVFVLAPDSTVVYHGAPDGDAFADAPDAGWLRAALDDVLAARPLARPVTTPTGCTIKWTLR